MNARILTAVVLTVGLSVSGASICAAQTSRPASTPSQAAITVPLTFEHYYTYEQVGDALKALHAAYPDVTTVEVIGKSDEGRDIWP